MKIGSPKSDSVPGSFIGGGSAGVAPAPERQTGIHQSVRRIFRRVDTCSQVVERPGCGPYLANRRFGVWPLHLRCAGAVNSDRIDSMCPCSKAHSAHVVLVELAGPQPTSHVRPVSCRSLFRFKIGDEVLFGSGLDGSSEQGLVVRLTLGRKRRLPDVRMPVTSDVAVELSEHEPARLGVELPKVEWLHDWHSLVRSVARLCATDSSRIDHSDHAPTKAKIPASLGLQHRVVHGGGSRHHPFACAKR